MQSANCRSNIAPTIKSMNAFLPIILSRVEALNRQVKKQLERSPGPLPAVEIARKPMLELKYEDFTLLNYNPQGFIKFPVAV